MSKYSPSSFFFPLKTNVGYFDSPTAYLSLTERIKQASLLYENLIFEDGMYQCTIWEEGSIDGVFPVSSVDKEKLAEMKANFQPIGQDSFFSMTTEHGARLQMSGPAVRRFQCEFHSALQELNAEHLPWITLRGLELKPKGLESAAVLQESLKDSYEKSFPNTNTFLKDKMLLNLSQDLYLSSAMNVAASMDAVYAPLLQHEVNFRHAPGFAALEATLPDMSHLGWDEIVELRGQDSLVEFRQKMVELENMALEALPLGEIPEVAYRLELLHKFIEELTRELAEKQPSSGGVVGDVMLDLMVGLIPVPGVSAVVTGARGAAEVKEANQSWVAAYLKLTKATR